MINTTHINNWLALPNDTKLNIFQQTATQMGIPANAIEKDFWVVHTLLLLFELDCAPHLVFKGGTSLSKAWGLIERFSEDIDLALDRKFLGFDEDVVFNTSQLKKLKRKSFEYVSTQVIPALQQKFIEAGFTEVQVKYKPVDNHDQDPLVIEIYYNKLTETDPYLKPGILVEIGSRSLKEPFTLKTFTTFIAKPFATQPFADSPITIPVVNPERTFLEKIFLLHEEFQKPAEKIRVDRLSRHLYDIEKMTQTPIAQNALQDAILYNTIVQHRATFTALPNIDYNNHQPQFIAFVPPTALLPAWQKDYEQMTESMIHDQNVLTFDVLIKNLQTLQQTINTIQW
jgi:Nucleotidyl transferase AbiEii toxin, Type IV TA system